MAMAAAVPITAAARAETKAIIRVVDRALIMERLSNICRYQSRVKPPHRALDLDWLKDNTIIVRMGAYKKIRISTI